MKDLENKHTRLREHRLKKRFRKLRRYTVYALIILGFVTAWLMVAFHLEAKPKLSYCPGQCFLDNSYYANYEQDSFKYINSYCNNVGC